MIRVGAAGALLLLACRPPESNPAVVAEQAAANDTLRGTLLLEGSDPFPIAVLQTSGGRVTVDNASAPMRKLAQLELWMRGTRTSDTRFVVADYRVRAVNGVKAWDGFLRRGPTGFRLELDDGTSHEIRSAPASFAQFTRSRMWITENPDGTVREYGVF
ncbi:MAG TPA: hypothetical protein VNO75_10845 [Gemmatimonadaceae bacterium]|nr:hypothetical protein [Gemmatimonadaceae bacterium]